VVSICKILPSFFSHCFFQWSVRLLTLENSIQHLQSSKGSAIAPLSTRNWTNSVFPPAQAQCKGCRPDSSSLEISLKNRSIRKRLRTQKILKSHLKGLLLIWGLGIVSSPVVFFDFDLNGGQVSPIAELVNAVVGSRRHIDLNWSHNWRLMCNITRCSSNTDCEKEKRDSSNGNELVSFSEEISHVTLTLNV